MGAGASASDAHNSLRPKASPAIFASGKKKKVVKSRVVFRVSKVAVKRLHWKRSDEHRASFERHEGWYDLHVQRECISMVKENELEPLYIYSYPDILCWGHSDTHWTFKAILEKDVRTEVSMDTKDGAEISTSVMTTVRRLMSQMDAEKCHEKAVDPIKATLQEAHQKGESVLNTLEQVAMTRSFTAHQAASILKMVRGDDGGNCCVDHFDLISMACSMHEKLINPDASFHVILDCFADRVDRDNICKRLDIDMENLYRDVKENEQQ